MKNKRIILHKDQVLYDIESTTYKTSEATGLEKKAKNVVAADHNIQLDGRMLARLMDVRDARLRKRLRFCLAETTKSVSCDNPAETKEYIYDLSLNDKFDDNMLDVVQTEMHDYMVKGVLCDWYKRLGVQGFVSDGELLAIEESIVAVLRTPSYMKVPLQPFGPAKKII